MAFDWAAQKDAWQGKLKVTDPGWAVGNAPGTKTIKSLDCTLELIKVLSNKGAIEEQAGPANETRLTISKDGKEKAYVLPWKESALTITELGGNHSIFVTPQLTGCAVFVSGEDSKPTVVHANANPSFTESGRPKGPNEQVEFEKDVRIPRWDSFYGALAQMLATEGHLCPNTTKTVLPSRYSSKGEAAVFGVKDGSSWKFYVNAGNETNCFWPG